MNDTMDITEVRYGPGTETTYCQFSVTYATPAGHHLYINGKCIGWMSQNAVELMATIRSSANLWSGVIYRYY